MFWQRQHSEQLRAAFEWLSGIVHEADVILVQKEGRDDFFRFKFPLHYGDMPRCVRKPDTPPTFTIYSPGVNSFPHLPWVCVFSSPELEIFENTERTTGHTPIRYGLSQEERALALHIAREVLEQFLGTDRRLPFSYFSKLPGRFHLRTDVCVALWTDGVLRGSAIAGRQSLGFDIADAVIRAARDRRFKPLSQEDLAHTRIQITVMNTPRIPLSKGELDAETIYFNKGYALVSKEGAGWLLPEIFNVKRFERLSDFLDVLAKEKAGLSVFSPHASRVEVFEVEDFIDGEEFSIPLKLHGPVVERKLFSANALSRGFRDAADWLVSLQEPDGNIPPIVNPFTGRQTQVDAARLAFSASALAEFGKAVGDDRYLASARSALRFLERFFLPDAGLAGIYSGQLALSLGADSLAEAAASRVLEQSMTSNGDPIAHAQAATLFAMLAGQNKKFVHAAEQYAESACMRFNAERAGGRPVSLALYAELAHTYAKVFEATGVARYADVAKDVEQWLLARQLRDGSFPATSRGGTPYVRGTGKVFEVLAARLGCGRDAVLAAARWLLNLQYDRANTFFVAVPVRERILGGFRHDYGNPEAWIDAAAHFILGGARCMLLER